MRRGEKLSLQRHITPNADDDYRRKEMDVAREQFARHLFDKILDFSNPVVIETDQKIYKTILPNGHREEYFSEVYEISAWVCPVAYRNVEIEIAPRINYKPVAKKKTFFEKLKRLLFG